MLIAPDMPLPYIVDRIGPRCPGPLAQSMRQVLCTHFPGRDTLSLNWDSWSLCLQLALLQLNPRKDSPLKVIAYTYDAAMHCVSCTSAHAFAVDDEHPNVHGMPGERDENDVLLNAVDREGNLVWPVFSTDEIDPDDVCDDCRARIAP